MIAEIPMADGVDRVQAAAFRFARYELPHRPHVHVLEVGKHASGLQQAKAGFEDIADRLRLKVVEGQAGDDVVVPGGGLEFLERTDVDLRLGRGALEAAVVLESLSQQGG